MSDPTRTRAQQTPRPGAEQRTPTPSSRAREALAFAADPLGIIERARNKSALETLADPLGVIEKGKRAAAEAAEAAREAARRKLDQIIRERVIPPVTKASAATAVLTVLGLATAGGIIYAISRR